MVGGKISLKKNFVFLLDSKRDWREAAGACGQLADWRGPGRAVLSGRPGRLRRRGRRRGRRRLAAVRFLQKAGCDLCVSNFPLFLVPAFVTAIYFY